VYTLDTPKTGTLDPAVDMEGEGEGEDIVVVMVVVLLLAINAMTGHHQDTLISVEHHYILTLPLSISW